jgi:imidazole glycerol-phosphate synthase subunit HisH
VISIIDYGAGNLRSVENTLHAIGAEYQLVRDADSLRLATKIVLPGVGHFGQMMSALHPLRSVLVDRIQAAVPFLGICLGLQALFDSSEEAPEAQGFGLFEGRVRRFSQSARVPHMGWNNLTLVRESRLLEGAGEQPYMYFANSYYAPVVPATLATCDYGIAFTAAIEVFNIFGVQFHPEKSGPAGLTIMKNFADLCL